MTKRLVYIMALITIIVVPLRGSPPIGAVVQTWNYDSHTNSVTAQIVNVSHKDITAYNIAVKETYADGYVDRHELMTDHAGLLAFIEEVKGTPDKENVRKRYGDGLFHPGESRNEIVHLQARPLVDFEAVVDVVAYADGTGEATNSDAMQRLLGHRKATLVTRQIASEIIKVALADPKDADPAGTAASKLQERITAWRAQRHTRLDFDNFESGEAKGIVDELRAISLRLFTNKRDALTQYLGKNEKRIAMLSPHAELSLPD